MAETVPMALCIAEPKRLFSSWVVRTSSAHTSGHGPGFNTPQWEVTSPVRRVRNKGIVEYDFCDHMTLITGHLSPTVFILMFELNNNLQRSSKIGKAHCTANLHFATAILMFFQKMKGVHVYIGVKSNSKTLF
jgi:hypothetical protein